MMKKGNAEGEPKKVFVSYSWDNEKLKEWVAGIVNKLRQEYGIDAIFDENSNQNNFNRMMANISSYDKIILIITKNYTEKVNKWATGEKAGGVGTEVQLYFDQIFSGKDNIIPVLKEECDLPQILSGIKFIDFSSGMIGYPKFEKLVRRIFDIQNYNIPDDVKRLRIVKPKKVPNPITTFEQKQETLDIHIIEFLEKIEKSKNDNISIYDLLFEIYNKRINEKYLPSIYNLYEYRKNNKSIFLEENVLWGKLFVNIWNNNYELSEIAIQNIIYLLQTKEFFIVNAIVESIIHEDSLEEFYIIDDVLNNMLAESFVKCLEIKNHILVSHILVIVQTIGLHTRFNTLKLLLDLSVDVQISYFQQFTYAYNPKDFFSKEDIDLLLQFANINDLVKNDIFDIISNLCYIKSIEVLYGNNIYDKEELIDVIINFNYKSIQNKEYLLAYRKRLYSYPNQVYVQNGSDKVKADILEYLIIESNVDRFIENFPEKYHGLENDNRIINNYLSKVQLTESQSVKMEKIFKMLDDYEE